MIIPHTLQFLGKTDSLDSNSQQPLCTKGLQKYSRCVKQSLRLPKTCWALRGSGASLKRLWGAGQDLAVAQSAGFLVVPELPGCSLKQTSDDGNPALVV